ncbi:MAG TPA: hypothetical protein VK817_00800 [Trebonia sp.]|jgi:hypothetical protein|nr:hypothetical protein [Trebonia sp.]
MANQQWVTLVNSGSPRASGAGTTLSASATTATISPTQAQALTADVATVNPDGQPLGWQVGMLIRVSARGFVNTGGTTSNLSWLLTANKGNSNSYQTLATTTTLALGVGSVTGLQWELDALIRCTAVNTQASAVGACSTQGSVKLPMAVPGAPVALGTGNAIILPMPNISGETSLATVDTSVVTGIGLRATLSAAFGAVACTQWLVEALD